MGGRGSKPVRTIIAEPEDGRADEQQPEEVRDEAQTAEDTLGIVAAEQDYPEAAPPSKDLPTIPEEEEEAAETISVVDDIKTKSGESLKPETDVIIPVQIGTSLQKTLSKTTNDVSYLGTFERRMNDADSSITEALMSLSMTSRQNSTLAEHSLNLMHTTLEKKRDQAALTQRETMLLERESYEYRRLTAQSSYSNMSTTRGQVRRHVSFKEDSQSPKRDVSEITANEAAERHKQHKAKSFKSLTVDLTSGLRSDATKVKAILAWICRQSIGRIDFGQTRFDPDTPNGYMQLMQEGKGTYPGLFALLCRAAGIKCAIITGASKGAGYEVGSTSTDSLQNAWNAVFVDEGWRLVHPLWVCKSLAGRRPGGWVTIETQGTSRHDVSKGNGGFVSYSYNDYFVFTKPEEFIYRHFPDDPKWQLLPDPISCEDFLSKTYVRPTFFTNEFTLLSDDKCVFESDNGEPVTILIGFRETVGPDLVFGYELSLKFQQNEEENLEEDQPHSKVRAVENHARFVFVSKGRDQVRFEVRFSKMGVYKLRIFGGLFSEYRDNPPWVMEAKLICNGVTPELDPLPFDPGIIGWGPSPIAESLGLFVPSHDASVVRLTFEDVTVIHFILKQRMEFDISLRHFKIRPGVLEDHVKYEVLDVMDVIQLRISLTCPKPGEYALKIDVAHGDELENACNYLVKTGKEKRHETYHQRNSRKLLTEAMMTRDKTTLAHALKACEESAVPFDDPEILAAEKRLEYLHCKEEMKTALLVNRIDKSEGALYRVQQANLERLFEREIRKVKHHLKELLALDKDGWNSRIPEIDRISLMELGQLRQPKQPVKYVVMTMYMLLGVSQETMTDWSQIKQLLRNKDSTLVEMARLENYLDMESVEIITIDESVLERVEDVLQTYSEEDIRKIDNTAAAYYIWVRTVHEKLKQKIRTKPTQASRSQSMRDFKQRSDVHKPSAMNVRRHNSTTNEQAPSTLRGNSNLKPRTVKEIADGENRSLLASGLKSPRRPLTSMSNTSRVSNSLPNGQSIVGQTGRQSAALSTRSRPVSLISYRTRTQGQTYGDNSSLNQIPGLMLTGDGASDVRNWTKSYRSDGRESARVKTSLSRKDSRFGNVISRNSAQSRQEGRLSAMSTGSTTNKRSSLDTRHENTRGSLEKRLKTPVMSTDKSLTQFSMTGVEKKPDLQNRMIHRTPSIKSIERVSVKQGRVSRTGSIRDSHNVKHRATPSPKQVSRPGTVKSSSNLNARSELNKTPNNTNATSPTDKGIRGQSNGRLKTARFRKGTARVRSQTSFTKGRPRTGLKIVESKEDNETPRTNSNGSNKDQTFVKNKKPV